MRWVPGPLAGVLLLPFVCASSCTSGCDSEKCGGPSPEYVIRGSLVTISRIAGHLKSRPTAGQIFIYTGAVPHGPVASTIRTTRSGTFEVGLPAATYYFGGKSDETGVTCSSAGALKVGTASRQRITVMCPSR
jgi:hypothetical protein